MKTELLKDGETVNDNDCFCAIPSVFNQSINYKSLLYIKKLQTIYLMLYKRQIKKLQKSKV